MSGFDRIKLLSNASATGEAVPWFGGEGTFHVVGNFNGATVSLQRLGPDNVTYTDLGDETTLTASGMANFNVGPGMLRALVSGGTPSGLYAEVAGTGR